MQDWQTRVEEAGIALLLRNPFLGRLFIQLPQTADPACPDLCLKEDPISPGHLIFRPEWVVRQPMPQLVFLLQRELYFWLLGHASMEPLFPDSARFVWASELALNAVQGNPPEGTCCLSGKMVRFEGLDPFHAAGDIDVYYQVLKSLELPPCQPDTLVAQVFARYAFRKVAPESVPFSKELAGDRKAWLLHEIIQGGGPEEIGFLPEAVQEFLERIQSGAHGVVDWKRILRRFVLGSQGSRIRQTWRRPSLRYGTFPGNRVVSGREMRVVVDTSASVDARTLSRFWEEMARIQALGIRVIVAECDTRVRAQYLFSAKAPPVWTGRGGTLYDEPIRLGNGLWRPGLMAYFTDGEGPAPGVTPRFPLLWVIAGEKRNLQLPGQVVWMNPEKQSNTERDGKSNGIFG